MTRKRRVVVGFLVVALLIAIAAMVAEADNSNSQGNQNEENKGGEDNQGNQGGSKGEGPKEKPNPSEGDEGGHNGPKPKQPKEEPNPPSKGKGEPKDKPNHPGKGHEEKPNPPSEGDQGEHKGQPNPPILEPIPQTPPPSQPTPTPTPTPTPPQPSTPSTPPSEPPPSMPTPSQPSPSTPTPSQPSPSKTTSPPSTSTSSSPAKKPWPKAKCTNPNYHDCYNWEQLCPRSCPDGCEVDCYSCKPYCWCEKPGSICQDPKFVGGDGLTFYFHGKKDRDFCLLSDPNLHINAHFIGRRNRDMKRDFTWVQSLGILFDSHRVFIGARRTSVWDDSADRLSLSFDGRPIFLPETRGAKWQNDHLSPNPITITRLADTNRVAFEVDGKFRITATVTRITEEESRVHNYGITKDDCFAHLDLGFKFYSLSDEVSGVLGQTYGPNYVSRVNVRSVMPVLGGFKEFVTTGLFEADCAVAQFGGGHGDSVVDSEVEYASMRCGSGINGRGIVCKK